MKPFKSNKTFSPTKFTLVLAVIKVRYLMFYITVTNWKMYPILATKCAFSKTSGIASIALMSNAATRIDAISERVVFDVINTINHFSEHSYFFAGKTSTKPSSNSTYVTVAQIAHDVLVGSLPNNLLTSDISVTGTIYKSLWEY
jgi:hypothetical protein